MINRELTRFLNENFDRGENDLCTEIVKLFDKGDPNSNVLVGTIRILQNQVNKRCRVLMRTYDTKKILLNHYINPELKFVFDQFEQIASIEYDTVDFADPSNPKEKKLLITFPPHYCTNAHNFYNYLLQAQNINKSLITQTQT